VIGTFELGVDTNVLSEDEPAIEEALFTWKDATADFADCLIGAKNRRLV
jgi:predicted nucleic-acid-binding protein